MVAVPIPLDWVANAGLTPSASAFQAGVGTVLQFLLNPPFVHAVQITTGQSLPNNAFTPVTFNSEIDDNEVYATHLGGTGMHDNVTNNSRLICRTPGRYMLLGGVAFASNATGRRGTVWSVNGSFVQGTQNIGSASATTGDDREAKPWMMSLAVNDYVELRAYQDTGSAMSLVVASPSYSWALARWMGP